MADPKSLYQEVILDHNRKPRNYGELAQASHKAQGHNPLCGDHLSVALNIEGGQIAGIAFQGESCAICKASASMMTASVKGKTRADAETLIREAGAPPRAAHRVCRRARSADARQVRDPAMAHAACRAPLGRRHLDRIRK